MKIKKIIATPLLIVAVSLFTGCESKTQVKVTSNVPANADSNKAANMPGNSAAPVSKSETMSATPTEAARAMFDATRNKDVEALKKQFSADSRQKLEEAGKQNNKSLDEVLTTLMSSIPLGDTFESRNESIDGDKATVELNDKNGKWTKNSFVKENGGWKISIK